MLDARLMWETKYALTLPKNLGVRVDFLMCSTPDVLSLWLTPNKKTLQTQNFANLQAIYQEIRNYEGCERKEQQIFKV